MPDLVVNRNALPDWYSCQSVVFVYPYKMRDREHLIPFYNKLWQYIPDDIGITLVVKDKSFSQDYLKTCRDKGISNQIDFIECKDIQDIWIRDFAPLTVLEGNIMTAWQFEYKPSYVKEKYHKYLQHDHKAGELIWKHIHGYGVNSAYFRWDLGNLTYNGKGAAIVTNRLIADNQEVNIWQELKPMLHVFAGFKNLVFIPTEPDDKTGHVDGMVGFIDEKTLVVGAYPTGSSNNKFMDMLADNLQKDLGDECTIIRLMNGEPEDFESEGIGSAVGNHMNFLRINDTILFPYFGDEISQKPLQDFISLLKNNNLNINVIPVDMPEIIDMARLGGVLNCIGWQVY
jgi:agmatine deiminase